MFAVLIIPTFVIFLVTYPIDKNRTIANWLFMFVGRSFIWFNPGWKIELRGLENYVPGEGRIFIANHQSFCDMPLLASLPWQMKWVSKESLYKAPVLGQYMAMAGHIYVKRGTAQALISIKKLHPYLKNNIPVMMFPEGTRSRTGELLKFKSGAFLLSNETGVPIQPILISGTRNVLQPDTWIASSSGIMTASILPAVDPKDYETAGRFRDAVYSMMNEELQKLV
jgi:1-acyl-sn-glycerol-3-phosphate acyltransferase